MMNNEMVIKGLECCIKYKNCDGCPYACYQDICFDTVLTDALEVIKSQQSELDELHTCIQYQIDKRFEEMEE